MGLNAETQIRENLSIKPAPPLHIGDVEHLGGGQIRHICQPGEDRHGPHVQADFCDSRHIGPSEAAQAVRYGEKLTTSVNRRARSEPRLVPVSRS